MSKRVPAPSQPIVPANMHDESRTSPVVMAKVSVWRSVAVCGLLSLLLVAGCAFSGNQVSALPNRYEIESEDLVLRSDLKIKANDPMFVELKQIRDNLTTMLELPAPNRPVVIHLFGDDQRYRAYMRARHPNLPARRAFFIGTPTELGVYAHWSPNVGEDLRHEYTHGVLHASLRTVPLWLDEGLAEYFETPGTDSRRLHADHMQRLALALQKGWRPNLARLEQLETVNQMQQEDYQEAWAWVHFLLHDVPGGRALLVDYCQSLKKSDKPPCFNDQVSYLFPDADARLASYLSTTLTARR